MAQNVSYPSPKHSLRLPSVFSFVSDVMLDAALSVWLFKVQMILNSVLPLTGSLSILYGEGSECINCYQNTSDSKH